MKDHKSFEAKFFRQENQNVYVHGSCTAYASKIQVYRHRAQIFEQMGAKFCYISLCIKVHELELGAVCCKSAMATFDIVTGFKMVAFIDLRL